MVSGLLISESGCKTHECLIVVVMEESIETDPIDLGLNNRVTPFINFLSGLR